MCPIEKLMFDALPEPAQLNLLTAYEHYSRTAPQPNGAALVWGLTSAIEAVLRGRIFSVNGYADALRLDILGNKWHGARSLGEFNIALRQRQAVARFVQLMKIDPDQMEAVVGSIISLRNEAAHGHPVDLKDAKSLWDDVVERKNVFRVLHAAVGAKHRWPERLARMPGQPLP